MVDQLHLFFVLNILKVLEQRFSLTTSLEKLLDGDRTDTMIMTGPVILNVIQ